MTTRFKPDDLTEGLTGAIHETGHALYEQSRNLEYDGLPVNQVEAPCFWQCTCLFSKLLRSLHPLLADTQEVFEKGQPVLCSV